MRILATKIFWTLHTKISEEDVLLGDLRYFLSNKLLADAAS